MTIKGRILEFIHYKRMTDKEFSLSLGRSKAYISTMSKGPSEDVALKMNEIYPELNFDWVYTGRGDMIYNGYGVNISNNNQVHHGNGSQILGNVVNTTPEDILIKELELTKEIVNEKEKRISVLESLLEMYKLK